ncbi:MAG TPA: hypothetical protein VLA23_12860, partial [Candidatus Limnocylindrales bacterium]|nr:hypothetical protein [Candidatus Limnocylindrales bacterium]
MEREVPSRLGRSRTARLARLVWFGAAVVGALAGIAVLAMHLVDDPLADVRAYYDAGARLNADLPLYDQPATTNEAAFYRYPPLLAIAFRPIAALVPYEIAALAWGSLGGLLVVLTVAKLGARRFEVWTALGILGPAIGWALAVGQAQIEVTWLLA